MNIKILIELLNEYDEKKALIYKFLDFAPIPNLRKFIASIEKKDVELSSKQLFNLILMLMLNLFQEEKNENPLVASLIKKLELAIGQIIEPGNPNHGVEIIAALIKRNIFDQESFFALTTAVALVKIGENPTHDMWLAVKNLALKNLLTRENFIAITLNPQHASWIADAFHFLNQSELLTQENRNSLINHIKCSEEGNALRVALLNMDRHLDKKITQEDFDALLILHPKEPPFDFVSILMRLWESKIHTKENLAKVMKHAQFMKEILNALKEYDYVSYPPDSDYGVTCFDKVTQENFDQIIAKMRDKLRMTILKGVYRPGNVFNTFFGTQKQDKHHPNCSRGQAVILKNIFKYM